MAITQQLEAIAARMFPDLAPGVALAQTYLFLARVMSAGDWDEVKTVQEHFGKAAFRAVLDTPPSKVFDQPSWNLWHTAFELEPKQMPKDFFTVYPWFKARAIQKAREVTAEVINHLPDYHSGPIHSCDELQTA